MLRRTPMKRGTKPMQRGQALKAKAPMKRGYKPASTRENREYALACYGEPCFLRMPGMRCWSLDTVVPAHRNEGKGMGLKVDDELTVPACYGCHAEYDQGKRFTREEKREFWNRAFIAWKVARVAKMSGASLTLDK